MNIFRVACALWLTSFIFYNQMSYGLEQAGQVSEVILQPSLDQRSQAIIDLTSQNWGQGELYSLSGHWDFFWHELLDPTTSNLRAAPSTMPVPGAWHEVDLPGLHYPPMGYASYRVRIRVPPELTQLYLYMPDMASAYQLWSNGQLVGGNGVIGTRYDTETPAYRPKVLELIPLDGRLDLIIHTSNFHYQWGGVWYEPKLTDSSGVFFIRELPLISATIVGTLLIGTAVFSLALFLSRRQDRKVLFFSLLCFAIGIRRLLIDERALYLVDWFDWQFLQVIENLSIYLLLPLFLSYFAACFPNEVRKQVPRIGWLIAAPFCLAALTLPVHTFSRFNVPFQILLIFLVPYVFFLYGKALKAQRSGAKMFGFSLLIFSLAVVNDALNYSYLIDTPNMMHVGALAFVLFQLVLLVRRYLLNFRTIESMSSELAIRNRELVRLDEFKDEFLATTSHELRTPLHGIAGLAQLLKQEADDYTSSQRHKIDLIETTAQRLCVLVNDVLDFSSIKHGKLQLRLLPVHLRPLAENVLQTLKPLIKGKHLELKCSVDDDASYVLADEYRLQQILFNLLGNAIKFTERGSISLTARRVDNQVQIVVQDTGTGIEQDKIERLFQPFEQYLQEGSKNISGSGLGLSITRQLVQLHNGQITLSSEVGQGTQVCFTLPVGTGKASDALCVAPSEADFEQELGRLETPVLKANGWITDGVKTDSASASLTVPQGETALVFYADDEEVNRELVRSQLGQAGYQVKTFINGASLLETLAHQRPDLVLLDLVMPGLNGLETCQQIRKHYNSYEIPVVMLTARYQITDIVEALGAGANDYVTKPYHEKELLARVYSQLSVRRFWQAALENQQLKTELNRRDLLELELTKANTGLQQVLDLTDENVLLLDDELDIIFANGAAGALLGEEQGQLLGQPLLSFIDPQSCATLIKHTNSDMATEFKLRLLKQNRQLVVAAKPFYDRFDDNIDNGFYDNKERFFALLLSDADAQRHANTQDLLKNLTWELAESRQRISQIESALGQLAKVEEAVYAQPEQNSPDAIAQLLTPKELAKELIVKTLRTALLSWERHSHKSKAELAEKSRCWRVYIDGTTAKTRTLDKYLSVKTLPEKPRWRAVIKTANYVLDHCDLSPDEHQELAQLIQSVDQAYS